MAAWRPRDADPNEYDTLSEGIPEWMRRPFYSWLQEQFSSGNLLLHRASIALMEMYDMAARNEEPLAPVLDQRQMAYICEYEDDEHLLELADFVVAMRGTGSPSSTGWEAIRKLDRLLHASGSMWKVGEREGNVGLEVRVPQGVADAATQAMATPGHAGELLSQAWHAAFGRSPDYEKAYSKAVKAVEAAVIPVVQRNHTGATLGTVLGQLKTDGDWSLAMTRDHKDYPPSNVLVGMAQMLWTGQNDRHAGQPGYTPSTQAEAEAAVLLAVPLVQLFSSGAVARR